MTAPGIVARATSRELSPKERAVADFYAGHLEEAAFLSAAEIAERLGTSDATVVRAVKALGYTGIPELRRELIDALGARATPAGGPRATRCWPTCTSSAPTRPPARSCPTSC